VDRIDTRAWPEMNLRGTAVESGDAVGPQPVQQVGVVSVSQKGFRVIDDQLLVKVGNHGDLVFATDRSQDRADRGVTEGSIDIFRALPS
jgi:hypothetical protein